MTNLPGRRFTLIGDSGELDPEVFSQLRAERPEQVLKIVIRDVVDARRNAPERLRAVDSNGDFQRDLAEENFGDSCLSFTSPGSGSHANQTVFLE